jgi:hypothetical protein
MLRPTQLRQTHITAYWEAFHPKQRSDYSLRPFQTRIRSETEMSARIEKVFAIYRYHDAPRSGVADCDGKAHFFEWMWDADADDYGPACLLYPISSTTFELVLEDWKLWMRWKAAFKEQKVAQKEPSDEHPVLPEDEARYKEIAPLLRHGLSAEKSRQFKATGKFRRTSGGSVTGVDDSWEVSWDREL